MATRPRRSTNPFKPTFGSMPFALAGRNDYIDDVIEGLANQPGDPNRSTIFIGPRGSGKTVLLRTIAEEASQQGWVCVTLKAREGMMRELYDTLRRQYSHLLSEKAKSVLTGIQVGPVGIQRTVFPEEPLSDRFRLAGIIDEISQQGLGFLVAIDEVDPSCEELIEFIGTYQLFVMEDRDVALMMAGLPSMVSALLLDEHVSFVRRAFQRRLDPIQMLDVEESLLDTIESNGKRIDDDALVYAAQATQGFAYAIQLVGFLLWREGRAHDTITMEDARRAVARADDEMFHAIVEPTLSELSSRELDFLKAMAEGDGPVPTSEVARRMGVSVTNASNLRRRLADRGIVASPRFGEVDFIMPVMREYLRS